jgi:hypothetical protein
VLSLLSRHLDRSNKVAAVRNCNDLKQVILTPAAIHGQPLWNGLGKNYLLGKIVISKQA